MRRSLAALACSCALLAGCSSVQPAASGSPTSGTSMSGTSMSSTSMPGGSMPGGSMSGAVASGTSPSAATVPAAADTIVIKNFAFEPSDLSVAPGATVTVTNEDATAHTVTATVTSSGDKAFDTGDIAPGRTVTFTAPGTAGTYAYICEIHQYMQGTLTVR
jgi:plastocyanin